MKAMHRLGAVLTSLVFLPSTAFAALPQYLDTPLPMTPLPGNMAYFKPPTFTKQNAKLIRRTMKMIGDAKPRGLIIDLRNHQGGELTTAEEIIQSFIPRGTAFMRDHSKGLRRPRATRLDPVLKPSLPIVLLRDENTLNEADIVIYILQKLRKAGVVEYSSTRNALKRMYKQHSRMEDYRPIKDSVFFIIPTTRIIGNQGGSQADIIPRAGKLIKDMSPWDEPYARRMSF